MINKAETSKTMNDLTGKVKKKDFIIVLFLLISFSPLFHVLKYL